MIIHNIEKIMQSKGITAYKLEKDTGIKQGTFQGWKRGSQPTVDKIEILIDYLKVSADELFSIDINKTEFSQNEKDMLELFRKLPENEQLKEIGRLEARAEECQGHNKLDTSSISKTG